MSSLYESVLQIIISKYWQLLLHSDSRLVRSQANSSSASNTAFLSFGNLLLKFFCFSIGKTPSFRYNRLQKRRVFTVQFLLKRAARFFFYYQQVIKIFFPSASWRTGIRAKKILYRQSKPYIIPIPPVLSVLLMLLFRIFRILPIRNVPQEVELVCLLPVGIAAQEVAPVQNKKPFKERAWFNGYGKNEYQN